MCILAILYYIVAGSGDGIAVVEFKWPLKVASENPRLYCYQAGYSIKFLIKSVTVWIRSYGNKKGAVKRGE